jgi:TonB family protein
MRAMQWMGAVMALATFPVLWADDVKLVRINSIPDSKIVHKVQPAYPPDAIDHHIQGVVKVSVTISTDGRVERIHLIEGHKLLAPAALQAVRRWVFEPTQAQGHAVKVMTQIAIPFTLDASGNPVTSRPAATPLQ